MNIKKLAELASAFVLSLSSLIALGAPLAHAVPPVHTWKGGVTATSGDHKFSTATNWVEGTAPASGDDLVFPYTDTMADFNPVNDMTGASFGTLTFSGDPSVGLSTSGYGGIYDITGNSFTLSGGIADTSAKGAFVSIESPIVLSGSPTFSSTYKDSLLMLDGVLSGSGFTVSGQGFVSLNGDNSAYNGAITVNSGTIVAASTNAFGPTTAPGATLNNGADVEVTACALIASTFTDFNGNLTLSGGSSVTTGDFVQPKLAASGQSCAGGTATSYGATSATPGDNLTFHGTITLSSDITFAGTADVTTLSGPIVGAHKITMLPGYTGKLDLSSSSNGSSTANGTYTSALFTKTLSDSLPSQDIDIYGNNVITLDGERGLVGVFDGGVLNGTGTVDTLDVDNKSILAPGHSPGCMTVKTSFTLAGTYQAQIGGTDPCSGYDQIKVLSGGSVDVTGATLATSLYGGFVPKAGQSFTIIDNQDSAAAVVGTFAGLAEGATVTADGVTYTITYKGGTGNDVVLTVKDVNASNLPSKPNTGMRLVASHPAYTLIAASLAAGVLLMTARRFQPATKKR